MLTRIFFFVSNNRIGIKHLNNFEKHFGFHKHDYINYCMYLYNCTILWFAKT